MTNVYHSYWHLPWSVLLPLGLGTSLSLLGDASMYTVLPTHTVEAGIALASVGVMLSANRFIRLFSNGPVGWLSDRWPRRWVFVPALFIGALSTALYAYTSGYWALLVARLLWGIAWSGIWVTGNAIIQDVADHHNRGRLVGIYNVFFFAGAGLGSALGGWLTDGLGYRYMLVVEASLTAFGAVIALLFLPETQHLRRQQLEAERISRAEVSNPPVGRSSVATLERQRRPELVSAVALMGVNRISIAGILLPTLSLFLVRTFGEEVLIFGQVVGAATLTGLGLSLTTIVSALTLPIAATLSDWWGNRWRVAAIGLVPGIAGFGLIVFSAPWAILLGLPLASATSGCNQGMSTTLIGDLSGAGQRGRMMGLLFTVGDLASAIGPILAFSLIEVVEISTIYAGVVALLCGMLAVATTWSWRGQRYRTRPTY